MSPADRLSLDVAVAGAGPAGAVAATLLARSGWSVALVDPGLATETARGHKIGETLPAAADRMLRANDLSAASNNPRHRPIAGSLIAWNGPPQLTDGFTEPEGPALRLDRRAFDDELVRDAVGAGATPMGGHLHRPRRVATRWSAEISGQEHRELKCRWLVDATGRPASLARALGAQREIGPALVAIWAVGRATASGALHDRTLIARLADGWWYGARLPDGRPLAAFHTTPRLGARLRANPAEWLSRLGAAPLIADSLDVDAFAEAELHGSDARGSRLMPPTGPGWIAVGDAALAFDPIASQGILNAIAGGLTAPRIVTADDPNAAADEYTARLADVWSRYKLRRAALYAEFEA